MKKILTIMCLLFLTSPVWANNCPTEICVAPYDLSGGAVKIFSAATGSNFVSKKVAESIIKKEAKKIGNTNFDVKIESYSSADLMAGRFKSLEIKGKNINYDNLSLSSLYAKTICDFNYVIRDNNTKKITFKEALPFTFKVTANADNINEMLKSSDYQKLVDELNAIGGTFNLVKIKSTQIKIKDNKFLYIINLALPFMKNTQSVILSSDLTVENGRIALKDTKLINNGVSLDITKLTYMLKYLNPFDYSIRIMKDVSAQLQIQNVTIDNDEVIVTGNFIIPKGTIQ